MSRARRTTFPFDPSLTREGQEQAALLARKVYSTPFDLIVCSPYRRCIETLNSVLLQLPPCTRVVIDQEFGEVYGPPYMRTLKGKPPQRRELQEVLTFLDPRFHKQVLNNGNFLGEAPVWPETMETARLRFVHRFEVYLQAKLCAFVKFNYTGRTLIISHGDALQIIGSLLLNQLVEQVDYLGRLFISSSDTEKIRNMAQKREISCDGKSILLESRWSCQAYDCKARSKASTRSTRKHSASTRSSSGLHTGRRHSIGDLGAQRSSPVLKSSRRNSVSGLRTVKNL